MTTPQPNTVTVPTSWHSITLGQFVTIIELGMQKGTKPYDILKAIVPEIGRINASEEGRLNDALAFTKDFAAAFANPVPETLDINGVTIDLPQHLGSETTLMQRWSLDERIQDNRNPDSHIDVAINAVSTLSVYLCSLITGEVYDDIKQADRIAETIKAIPCTTALPIAAFFLSKYRNPTASGISNLLILYPSPTPKPLPTSWFPRLTSSLRSFFRRKR